MMVCSRTSCISVQCSGVALSCETLLEDGKLQWEAAVCLLKLQDVWGVPAVKTGPIKSKYCYLRQVRVSRVLRRHINYRLTENNR